MHINDHRGFALFEVLLAWVLLTTAVLGILSLQIKNLRSSRHVYFYTLATVQLQSMAERLRANTSAVFRIREQALWNTQNSLLLPHGVGEVICLNNDRVCEIVLHWQEWSAQSIRVTIVL